MAFQLTLSDTHPQRRRTDRPLEVRRRDRAVGLAWFSVMATMIAMAGPLFLVFFALGVVSAFGMRWMVLQA